MNQREARLGLPPDHMSCDATKGLSGAPSWMTYAALLIARLCGCKQQGCRFGVQPVHTLQPVHHRQGWSALCML